MIKSKSHHYTGMSGVDMLAYADGKNIADVQAVHFTVTEDLPVEAEKLHITGSLIFRSIKNLEFNFDIVFDGLNEVDEPMRMYLSGVKLIDPQELEEFEANRIYIIFAKKYIPWHPVEKRK